MMKAFVEYIKDTIALFIGIFLQGPTDRFDNINADTMKKSDPFHGHTAKVTEEVTTITGRVKYGGSLWKASVSPEFKGVTLQPGTEVGIVEAKGNRLVVKPK